MTKIASRGLSRSHIPPQLFQLSSHFCFGLPEIPGTSRQYSALETHFLAATTRIVRDFVLFNIASDLQGQLRVSRRRVLKHNNVYLLLTAFDAGLSPKDMQMHGQHNILLE